MPYHKLREVNNECALLNSIVLGICAKNYQIWWRFGEVLTKKVESFLAHPVNKKKGKKERNFQRYNIGDSEFLRQATFVEPNWLHLRFQKPRARPFKYFSIVAETNRRNLLFQYLSAPLHSLLKKLWTDSDNIPIIWIFWSIVFFCISQLAAPL